MLICLLRCLYLTTNYLWCGVRRKFVMFVDMSIILRNWASRNKFYRLLQPNAYSGKIFSFKENDISAWYDNSSSLMPHKRPWSSTWFGNPGNLTINKQVAKFNSQLHRRINMPYIAWLFLTCNAILCERMIFS